MVFFKLWYYITGYIEVKIFGIGVEKFVNLSLREKVLIWDITKQKYGYSFKTRPKDFFVLRHVAKETGSQLKIIRRTGLPFYLNKLSKRKMLVLGAIFFLIALYYLSSFVWFVDVSGNERVSDTEIKDYVRQIGLEEGSSFDNFDSLKLEEQLATDFDEIVWAGINKEGTRVLIEVVERDEPEKKGEQTPANIIAAKEATITDILALSGYPMVSEQDEVSQGDLLIAGRVVPTEEEHIEKEELEEYPLVAAKGYVRGLVKYQTSKEVPLMFQRRERTGESYTQYGFNFEDRTTFLHLKEPPFLEYDKEKTVRQLSLLPLDKKLGFIKETFYEVEVTTEERTRREANKKARERALSRVQHKFLDSTEVLDIEYRTINREDERAVEKKVVIEAEENIGELDEINETINID